MKRFITADWHLGEDRLRIMQRPNWDDASSMTYDLAAPHNAIVGEDDLVYVVGDAVCSRAPHAIGAIGRFNGRKILIRGNHDRAFTDEELKPYFEQIIPEGDGVMVEVKHGKTMLKCWITHYPSRAKLDCDINLVGHVHAAWKFQLHMINVGIDANHYRPHNLDEDIPFYLDAITDHYDEDVWAAYMQVNQTFRNHRGKAGNYFQENKKT